MMANHGAKNRVVLNPVEAAEIYMLKISILTSKNSKYCAILRPDVSQRHKLWGESSQVAKEYKVSPKTIRDIWGRRTWIEATRSLWELDPDHFFENEGIQVQVIAKLQIKFLS